MSLLFGLCWCWCWCDVWCWGQVLCYTHFYPMRKCVRLWSTSSFLFGLLLWTGLHIWDGGFSTCLWTCVPLEPFLWLPWDREISSYLPLFFPFDNITHSPSAIYSNILIDVYICIYIYIVYTHLYVICKKYWHLLTRVVTDILTNLLQFESQCCCPKPTFWPFKTRIWSIATKTDPNPKLSTSHLWCCSLPHTPLQKGGTPCEWNRCALRSGTCGH